MTLPAVVVYLGANNYDINFVPPPPPNPILPLGGEIAITLDQSVIAGCYVKFDQTVNEGSAPLPAGTPCHLSRGKMIPVFSIPSDATYPVVNMYTGATAEGSWCTAHPVNVSKS